MEKLQQDDAHRIDVGLVIDELDGAVGELLGRGIVLGATGPRVGVGPLPRGHGEDVVRNLAVPKRVL